MRKNTYFSTTRQLLLTAVIFVAAVAAIVTGTILSTATITTPALAAKTTTKEKTTAIGTNDNKPSSNQQSTVTASVPLTAPSSSPPLPSKLIFIKCTISSSSSIGAGAQLFIGCSNPSVATGDAVVGTVGPDTGCFDWRGTKTSSGSVIFGFVNECSSPQTFGSATASAIVFKPTS